MTSPTFFLPRWIQAGEKIVGEASITGDDDTVNRPAKDVYENLSQHHEADQDVHAIAAPYFLARTTRSDHRIDYADIVGTPPSGGGGEGLTGVIDLVARGLPDADEDCEPFIQEIIDNTGDPDHEDFLKPILFPSSRAVLLHKPLRIKTPKTKIFSLGVAGVIGGWGHGPLIVIYGDHSWGGAPGSNWPTLPDDTYEYFRDPLLTGDGKSFNVGRHKSFWEPVSHWGDHTLILRPTTSVLDVNGLDSFCVECTVSCYSSEGGCILGSGGRLPHETTHNSAYYLKRATKFEAGMTIDGVLYTLVGTTTVVEDTAYHLALTYDGATIRLFVDGTMEASESVEGTITQKSWEFINLGTMFDNVACTTHHMSAAYCYVDGVRFSNSALYTTNFIKPTTKPEVTSTTQLVLNFNEYFDTIMVGETQTGKAYLPVNPISDCCYNGNHIIDNLEVSGLWLGSSTRAAIWTSHQIGLHFDHCRVRGKGYQVYLNETFCSQIYRTAFEGGSWPLYFNLIQHAACGLNTIKDCDINGAYIQILGTTGQVYINNFQAASNGVYALFVTDAGGGYGVSTIINPVFSQETLTDPGMTMIANVILGDGGLQLLGGGSENWKCPAAIVNGGTFSWSDGYFLSYQPEEILVPIINIVNKPTLPVVLRNCRRRGSLLDYNIAWTDQPKWSDVHCEAKTRRVVSHSVITSPADGEVTIDLGDCNAVVIEVEDAGDFTINLPVNKLPSQKFHVKVINNSGGSMGTVTWAVGYMMAAWTNPANGYQRTIEFEFDGICCNEISRTPSDVPIAAFVPSDFSGLVAHWKADGLSLSNDDPVATWPDESVEGNDLSQATSGKRPVFKTNVVNGQPAVLFDGVDDLLWRYPCSTNFKEFEHDRTMYILFKPTADPVFPRLHAIFVYGDWVNGNRWTRPEWCYYGGLLNCDPGGFEYISPQAAEIVADAWHLESESYDLASTTYILRSNGDTGRLLAGGSPEPGDPVGTDSSFKPLTHLVDDGVSQYPRMELGGTYAGGGTGEFFEGYIAEMVVYDRALTLDEKYMLEGYFCRKYGLTFAQNYDTPWRP